MKQINISVFGCKIMVGLNEKGETEIAEIFKDAPKDGIVKNQDALASQTETDNRNSKNPNILENRVWPEIIEN